MSSGGYGNSRADLIRAIRERNITPEVIQAGLPYLQSGPVAGILNMVRPGAAQQLHSLFSQTIQEMPKSGDNIKAVNTGTANPLSRPGDPFPDLK